MPDGYETDDTTVCTIDQLREMILPSWSATA